MDKIKKWFSGISGSLKFSLVITSSKLLAFIIIIVGSILAFKLGNSEVFIFASGISASLHGLKSYISKNNETKDTPTV